MTRGHPGIIKEKHPCWKGGKIVDRDGYIQTWAPDHPWPRKGYLREHIRVMELAMGRRILPDECVHHKNHNRQNNNLDNLELMKRGKHSSEHRKEDFHKLQRDKLGRFTCGFIYA
ncbi:HNH nuclease [uncultured Caudovirales phage]|uniref:HNH nuclease n=1 Tax=uncultured Caudovirales phage TaxID=2100421 RepID=A0A6J5NZG0_9CAUD|nr:HNH nuclease [uncultured Caudovirales phage]